MKRSLKTGSFNKKSYAKGKYKGEQNYQTARWFVNKTIANMLVLVLFLIITIVFFIFFLFLILQFISVLFYGTNVNQPKILYLSACLAGIATAYLFYSVKKMN